MRKIFFSLVFFCLAIGFAQAQNFTPATPYQKQQYQILKKYYQKIRVKVKNKNYLTSQELEVVQNAKNPSYENYEKVTELVALFLFTDLETYSRLNQRDAEILQRKLKNELKAAEKLKNATDLRKDKEKSIKKKRNEIKHKPIGIIQDSIRKSFQKWNDRGEFEKESVWSQRLKDSSAIVFSKICNSMISKWIFFEINTAIDCKIGKYNADDESFMLEIAMKSCYNKRDYKIVVPKFQLQVPLKEAEKFRERVGTPGYNGYFINHCIMFSRYPSDYYCVDYVIYPKEMFFYDFDFVHIKEKFPNATSYFRVGDNCYIRYNEQRVAKDYMLNTEIDKYRLDHKNETREWRLPWCVRENFDPKYEIEDVVIAFDDLEIENPALKGCAFNYTRQKIVASIGEAVYEGRVNMSENKEKYCPDALNRAIATYNTHVLQFGYDTSAYKLNLKLPVEFEDDQEKMAKAEQTLLDSVQHCEMRLREKYLIDSTTFASYSDSLQHLIKESNAELSNYPYNIEYQKQLGEYSLSQQNFGMEDRLVSEFQEKKIAVQQEKELLKKKVYDNLRNFKPEKFVKSYFIENPEKKLLADSLYLECRCKYTSEQLFYLAFIDQKIQDCDCREKEFTKYGKLFKSKQEFDVFYNYGNDKLKVEVDSRIPIKNKLYELEDYLSKAKQVNLKEALTNKKEAVQLVVSKLQYFKNNYFYEEAVQILFTYNEKLAKEWKENGQYFESQVEMYEAYIGEEYKAILKGKKQ